MKWKLTEKAVLILRAMYDDARTALNTNILDRTKDAAAVVTTHFPVTSAAARYAVFIAFLATDKPICVEEACVAVSVKSRATQTLSTKVYALFDSVQSICNDISFETALNTKQMQDLLKKIRAPVVTHVVYDDEDEDSQSDDEDDDLTKEPELEPGFSFIGNMQTLYLSVEIVDTLGIDSSMKEISIQYEDYPVVQCGV